MLIYNYIINNQAKEVAHQIPSAFGRVCPCSHQNMVGKRSTWTLALTQNYLFPIKTPLGIHRVSRTIDRVGADLGYFFSWVVILRSHISRLVYSKGWFPCMPPTHQILMKMQMPPIGTYISIRILWAKEPTWKPTLSLQLWL